MMLPTGKQVQLTDHKVCIGAALLGFLFTGSLTMAAISGGVGYVVEHYFGVEQMVVEYTGGDA